jgi:hypothetical protein
MYCLYIISSLLFYMKWNLLKLQKRISLLVENENEKKFIESVYINIQRYTKCIIEEMEIQGESSYKPVVKKINDDLSICGMQGDVDHIIEAIIVIARDYYRKSVYMTNDDMKKYMYLMSI